ncbi:MAG: peptidoglycan bridge formation glycyltransferase FemA/FemB family protein [Patescibacteria group bacterium]|jgi:lipid II:glycine glycyltransferase (peptidoglycan interpeptide bridge formation enzyme)
MELKLISQQELNNFVATQPHSQLLQSYSWGEFNKTLDHHLWRLGIFNNEQIVACATIINNKLPLQKSYLYCPRGPIFSQELNEAKKETALKLIFSKTRDITIATRKSEEIFFRFEPIFELQNSKIAPSEVEGSRLIKTKSIQPPNTLILDLSQSTESLLASFHSKTRYNIKLAEKHGLTISKLTADDFTKCWPLFKQTSERDTFGLHSQSYYQTMLTTVPEVELWVARNQNNAIIAANLMSFYGDTVTYLHGASDYQNRNLMAPYLLHWTLIQEAQSRGFKYYDWHGIAPESETNHPWAGVTRFKKGFGGEPTTYAGTYDFIYETGWYKLYKVFRKINRIIK